MSICLNEKGVLNTNTKYFLVPTTATKTNPLFYWSTLTLRDSEGSFSFVQDI